MRRWRQTHLSPIFGAKEQNYQISYMKEIKSLNHGFQNCKRFQNRLKRYREITTRTWRKMNTFMRFAADRKKLVTSFPAKI